MTTIVVSGALAAKPGNGGNAWTRLAWTAALQRLGFDVWFVEAIPGPEAERAAAVKWAMETGSDHGLDGRMLLGNPADPAVVDVLADATLILNISGHLDVAGLGLSGTARVAAFLDDDPGFTQVWAAEGTAGSRLAGHDLHLTFGANIGRRGCDLPTGGITWHPVRPPILLDAFPAVTAPSTHRVTTVASWRGPYGAVTWNGMTYPLKHHEFRRLLPLPRLVEAEYDLALSIDQAEVSDLEALDREGWRVTDAAVVAGTPEAYRAWVQASTAEISAAHGVYAHTACGWISDRTAAYLASGCPAVVQSTGVESTIPTGEGLLTFTDLDGAARALRSVLDDFDRHAKTARSLAEDLFDAVAIAAHVCELAGVSP